MWKGLVCLLFLELCVSPGVFAVPKLGKSAILQQRKLSAEEFPFHVQLDDAYELYWSFTEEIITFEVHVETSGWAGFGVSPAGGMTSADLVIGWIDNEGETHFDDRHGVGNQYPPVDEQQDWDLLHSEREGSTLVLQFSRELDLCNEEDIPIEEGTVRVIWAFNHELPGDGENPRYHGENRGVKSLHLLLHTDPDYDLPNDTFTWDVTVQNASIPTVDTYYHCQLFEVPPLTQKYHAIRFEPIYTEGNEMMLHHMILYNCLDDVDHDNLGHECWVDGMPMEMYSCYAMFFTWTIGEEKVDYPPHTGFPFDPDDHPGWLMLEVHYDNPQLHAGRYDSSGMRLYLTPTLRQDDTGTLALGTLYYPFFPQMNLAIPPHAKSFRLNSPCPSSCVRKSMEEDGLSEVRAYGVMLHGHLATTKFYVRHFREGKELAPIVLENNYDFNFQSYIFLKEEITIYPTDSFEVICEWDTRDRETVTWGGPASRDEMCQAYMLYYPKFYTSTCWTEPSAEQYLKIIDAETEPQSSWPYYRVTYPAEFEGQTLQEILPQLNWSDPCLRKRLENISMEGEVDAWMACTTREDHFQPERMNYTILSDMDAEERVCGWQDQSGDDDVCGEDEEENRGITKTASLILIMVTILIARFG